MIYFEYNIEPTSAITINQWIEDYIEKTIINIIGDKKHVFMPVQEIFELLDFYKVNAHRMFDINSEYLFIYFDLFIMEGKTAIYVDRYIHELNVLHERRKLKIRDLE
jgi:hypothetical protein